MVPITWPLDAQRVRRLIVERSHFFIPLINRCIGPDRINPVLAAGLGGIPFTENFLSIPGLKIELKFTVGSFGYNKPSHRKTLRKGNHSP
jgi:hypothetical protein